MNAGSLPEPYARYVHPAETAQFTADGEHCEHRGCRQPVAVVGWYYRRREGRPEAVERSLCREHGEAFARRHHAGIDAAPAEDEIPRRVPAPVPGAALWGMSAGQIAEHEGHGWHCDFPRCTRPARYLSALRYLKGGPDPPPRPVPVHPARHRPGRRAPAGGRGHPVTVHAITIEIDDEKLASYTDEHLALCWHVAQHNPAEYGDYMAGELAERIGREIIRRWLRNARPELWRHQGEHHYHRELTRFARYEPGGPAEVNDTRAFHSGRWVPKTDENSSGADAGGVQ
jgi:hypothetical protein